MGIRMSTNKCEVIDIKCNVKEEKMKKFVQYAKVISIILVIIDQY